MENRGTHNGNKVFVKSIAKNDIFKYDIWEYTMRTGIETTNVYLVQCVAWDGEICGEFMYGDYKQAVEMIEYFLN